LFPPFDALFKSVEQKNRFKKHYFLNRLNKITDLISSPKGENQNNFFCNGEILKEFFAGKKSKTRILYRGKDLFTQKKLCQCA
jgi:hypothetical protein